MVDTDDEYVLAEVCWAVYNLVDEDTTQLPELMKEEVILKLLENFNITNNVIIVAPSMRIIGNMMNGSEG